ncbi:MAG: hypothetical protein IJV35_02585 [Neisseriaceae bacterium]|nr:hypothetical protein [Neisseriaceae bacterium]
MGFISSLWLDECFLDNASILFSGSLKKYSMPHGFDFAYAKSVNQKH